MSRSDMARKGGRARAAALTPERRREIARAGAKARWSKGENMAEPTKEPEAVYLATEAQVQAIELALHDGAGVECYGKAQAALDAIREAAANEREAAMAKIALALERQKGNVLRSVVDMFIERLAGEMVARGFLTLQAAQSWANEERMKVLSHLAAIDQVAAQEGAGA